MPLKLPKLDKSLGIVELFKDEYRPTPAFQRWWQSATVRADSASDDASTKVSQVDHLIYPETLLSTPPSQNQLQAMANALAAISQQLKE